jgi:hypothetical protein
VVVVVVVVVVVAVVVMVVGVLLLVLLETGSPPGVAEEKASARERRGWPSWLVGVFEGGWLKTLKVFGAVASSWVRIPQAPIESVRSSMREEDDDVKALDELCCFCCSCR